MGVYEVFSCCAKIRYKTTFCSSASIFTVVISLLTVLVPFFILCRSNGFWLRTSTYMEQPVVYFKKEYILILETKPIASPIICSTYPYISSTSETGHCAVVKSREVDYNDDGKNDELNLEFSIQVSKEASVHSFKLLLVFDYKLLSVSSLTMESLGYLHDSSSLPGARYEVVADLNFIQREPLNTYGKDIRYNNSVINSESLESYTFNLYSIIKDYSKRNVSTKLSNVFSMWTTGLTEDVPFILSAVVKYPHENIICRPRFWQIVKWAWIQYLSVLVIFIYVFTSIKTYVFCNYLIPTIKFLPWKSSFD